MQMQYQSPQGRIIRIWQRIDDSMHTIPPHHIIANPRRLDQSLVMLSRHEGIRKFPEELLHQVRSVIDIVVEGLRVPEIDFLGVVLELRLQLLDLEGVAAYAVDAFVVEAEEVDGLDALVDYQRDGGSVATE